MHKPLTVETCETTGASTVLKVAGELDLATTPVLRDAVSALPGSQRVVLDCAGVGFIDSSGINALVGLVGAGYELVITGVPDQMRQVLLMTGVDEIVKLED